MSAVNPIPITRDGAAAAAHHELSKSIYHRNSDPWPVRLMRAIGRFIDHLLNHAFGHAPGGGWGALIIVLVIAALVGLVIWRFGPPARNQAMPPLFTQGTSDTAADHRLRAAQAAEAGDWHAAVVERMRALARELEERGVLDVRPGRTATELSAEAATQLPAAAAALTAAARVFNSVAYGGVQADGGSLTTVAAADEMIRSAGNRLVQV